MESKSEFKPRWKLAQVLNVGKINLAADPPELPKQPKGAIRFVCISDTHQKHADIDVPDGDVLIHAGDFSTKGDLKVVQSLAGFLKKLPHKHKLIIAGNHDVTFHDEYYAKNWKRYHKAEYDVKEIQACLKDLQEITYLEDSEVIIEGVKIYGSPWLPSYHDWAFNLERGGEVLKQKWEQIPNGTDVLITHGPPAKHGGFVDPKTDTGCEDLLAAVQKIKPLVHVFGHIHQDYGVTKDEHTTYINACNLTTSYKVQNEPIVFDLIRDEE
jgi:Icc-related predicted phosphoesterase